MLLQTSFTAVGQLIIALLSWGILSQDWSGSYFNGKIGMTLLTDNIIVIKLIEELHKRLFMKYLNSFC